MVEGWPEPLDSESRQKKLRGPRIERWRISPPLENGEDGSKVSVARSTTLNTYSLSLSRWRKSFYWCPPPFTSFLSIAPLSISRKAHLHIYAGSSSHQDLQSFFIISDATR